MALLSLSPPPGSGSQDRGIPFISSPPSYPNFRDEHLLPLQPLIFDDPALPDKWLAHRRWTSRDEDDVLIPNVETIVEDFTGCTASVHLASLRDGSATKSYGEEDIQTMSFQDFARLWRDKLPDDRVYLKDFHLCLARPDTSYYTVYDLFQDDWMNAHAVHETSDDYRFLYLGSDGSSTAWHHDVYLSHSWSTSICGIKRWLLLDPEHASALKHKITSDVISQDQFLSEAQYEGYTWLDEARKHVKVVWQYPNETMFVPSGWWHTVTNFGQTLSINHNWANASCIRGMYTALAEQVDRAAQLLCHLRPPEPAPSSEHVEFWNLVYQNLVRPSWGWSFVDFWEMAHWVRKHPEGGEKWVIRANCAMSTRESRVGEMLKELARLWLVREEARWMDGLRNIICTV